MREEDSTMYTILKFLKRRWLISQNIAHFSTCEKPLNFQKFEKMQMSKLEETFSILELFKYSTFG